MNNWQIFLLMLTIIGCAAMIDRTIQNGIDQFNSWMAKIHQELGGFHQTIRNRQQLEDLLAQQKKQP